MQKPWNGDSEFRTYHDALEQVELADKVGFDYLWEVEHHFLAEYSHSSAPEVFLAAASQRTKNIRIGHGVALLPSPFNHPIRVAERAAALDIISNGRLELGTGRSITEQELGGFGIDPADSRPMWEEAVQMIPKMWTQETFSWEGDHFVVPPRNVIPKPIQKPHPPMWMACTQPDSFRIAGRVRAGRPLLRLHRPRRAGGDASTSTARTSKRQAGGRVREQPVRRDDVGAGRPHRRGGDRVREARGRLLRRVDRGRCSSPGGRRRTPRSTYQYYVSLAQMAEQRLQERPSFEEQFESGALCMGSVSAAAAWCRTTRRPASTSYRDVPGGRIPHEKVMQTIRLFGEEIIPDFK